MQSPLDRANSAPPGSAGPSGPTWLVTPGIAPARFATAVGSGAEVVLLDLEDSVPAGSKADARAAVLAFTNARARGSGGPQLGVRLNAVDTAEGLRDVAAIGEGSLRPDLVVVPKAESGREIEAVVQAVLRAQGSGGGCELLLRARASDTTHLVGIGHALGRLGAKVPGTPGPSIHPRKGSRLMPHLPRLIHPDTWSALKRYGRYEYANSGTAPK